MSKESRINQSERMRLNNPMYDKQVKLKSSKSHIGKSPWNKGLKGDEYVKHYIDGIRGGRPFGYKHTIVSKIKMSQNTIGKKHPNYKPSIEQRKSFAERMRKNRQDFSFNFKMFKSLQNNFTKPHRKVKQILEDFAINTISNYPIFIGNRYAEIDEADVANKIAIFVDGNYWHNYPNLRTWDKVVTSCLKNKGWFVIRIWESDIKNNLSEVIENIKAIFYIPNITQ
jgi:very-short-patch-repair endonuclease